MIPLYNTSDIRRLDSFAIKKLKVPGIVLMENASVGIYQAITQKYPEVKSIGIICGKGNNGGDGFAVARHFSNNDFEVKVLNIGDVNSLSGDCRINFEILKRLSSHRNNLKIKSFKSIKDTNWLKKCDLIVDAMLGSGFTGELKEPYYSIVKSVNKFRSVKCAVDIPTGLDSDTGFADCVFNSDLTVTLGEFKKGLFIERGYQNCGDVQLKEIGVGNDFFNSIYNDTYLLEPEDVFQALPKRNKLVNKYTAGKVLSIAGSYQYPGAGALTSHSALVAGAGASVLYIPESAKKLVHKSLTEVVVESYGTSKTYCFNSDALKQIKERIKWADVLVIGPGLGRSVETNNAVKELLLNKRFKLTVLDADALNALDESFLDKIDLSDCVFTPHIGEFSSLINTDISKIRKDILKYGRDFALRHKTVLILKGAPTIIFNKTGEALINTTGNSGMAKFGTGDVLTGILGGLLAQTKNIETAAFTAVYLHSLSADLLLKKKPLSNYLPTDIIKNFPDAVKFIEGSVV
ncbi:MAG: NAD(P)H-hydrate dehydratase [Ignavibacterium sp.]|jgi:NAD(P)H-hydrate epimerase|nr:NAD(P)H-hydrate dehydratase [Ignavibacterium sp.]